jgi:hypothetical protein
VAIASLSFSALGSGRLDAQGVRGWVGSTVRYVQLRPFDSDTFAFHSAVETPDGGMAVDGRPVICIGDAFCTALVPQVAEHAVVASQEFGFTAWGMGVEGLSVTALVRGRDQLSGEFQWPRSDDPLDVALGYVEWVGPNTRFRVGRQNVASGLGFTSFDGIEATFLPARSIRMRAFGGRSLARGLLEPRNEALRALEDFVPDDEAYLVGGSLQLEAEPGTTLELRYQREAWTDGHHLISERAAANVRTLRFAPLRLTASADYDFGFGRVGKAHLTAEYAARPSLNLRAHVRRYLPYFELSTIWGFFDPVGYHEAEFESRWTPASSSSLWAAGAWRRYGDTEVTTIGRPLEDDALRLRAGGETRLGDRVGASAEYRLELGAGSYLQSGDLTTTWALNPRLSLDARGSLFQQIGEFRLGDAIVFGGGLVARARLGSRFGLEGGFLRYRSVDRERADPTYDWSQTRAWTSLRIEVGGAGVGGR